MNVVTMNPTRTEPGWGASPAEWAHFSGVLSLTADLLPVVSNPGATISERSTLKDLGKTPSKYNQQREVVGIGNWTALQSTPQRVVAWAQEPDYGICLQARETRGLDIDVADVEKADAIAQYWQDALMLTLPKRHRTNSGKQLLAMRVVGELGKREVWVDGGKVELLCNGQQFIVAGTHPSGVRYEWEGGLPVEIPEITIDDLNAAWSALVQQFGTGQSSIDQPASRRNGPRIEIEDPVADFLVERELSMGTNREGAIILRCPWEDGHSSGTAGDTSTVWLKAGTRGYQFGHFDCKHASCAHRSDEDFKTAIGYVEPADRFAPVPVEETVPDDIDGTPDAAAFVDVEGSLRRFRGWALATLDNVVKALRSSAYCGVRIRHDQFKDEIVYTQHSNNQYQPFGDHDYSRLRIALAEQHRFKPIAKEMMRDAVLLVATEDPMDTAQEWLNQRKWDGVSRVATVLTKYFGVPDTPYHRASGRYIYTAFAGRVMTPGCKADMVPILVGKQGIRKSTAVKCMVPDDEFFVEISLDEKDDDLSRKLRGRLVAELGELRGLHTKELDYIKAFITRTHENWVPKYREFATKFPRRNLFIGTTNQEEFLADDTGNRRFLPIRIEGEIDTEGLIRDRDQLWAEAAEIYMIEGVAFADAERLAPVVHAEHVIGDPWEEAVGDWLHMVDPVNGQKPADSQFLRTGDVLRGALGLDPKHVKRYEEMRMGRVLRVHGYERKKLRVDGRPKWVFVPTPFPSEE